MAKIRLNLSEEDRRIHDNELHRKQMAEKRKQAEKLAFADWVRYIFQVYEKLGWDETELLIGPEDEMVEKIVAEIINEGRFKVVLGKEKLGIKRVKE